MYERGYSGKYGVTVTKGASIFFIILGFLWIPYAIYVHAKFKNEPKGDEFYICSGCKAKYPKKWVDIEICPKCDHKLILENLNKE